MDTPVRFPFPEAPPIVYVRPVAAKELPQELRAETGIVDGTLYAIHSVDGERLALVRDRETAFILARQNQLQPVTVH